MDGCERDPLKANHMNNAGPAVVAAAAAKIGAKTAWYSTDYVFDGGVKKAAGPYSEADAPAPLNIYGSSKLEGEKSVLAADPTALVIRTNCVVRMSSSLASTGCSTLLLHHRKGLGAEPSALV